MASETCFDRALKTKAFNRVLKRPLENGEIETIKEKATLKNP
jgi:hypothetical protein